MLYLAVVVSALGSSVLLMRLDEEWTHVVLCTHRYFVPSLEFFVNLREIYTTRCMGDETPRSSNTRWKQRLQMRYGYARFGIFFLPFFYTKLFVV